MGLQDAVRPLETRWQTPAAPLLLAAVLAVVVAGDVARGPARAPAGLASRRTVATVPGWPRFVRFGWVSPPREFATAGRYAELAGAGFDLALPAWADSGRAADNLARLGFTRGLGVVDLLLDDDLDAVRDASAAALARVDSVARRYRDDPAFAGWYLGDEPAGSSFARLGLLFGVLRARDPAHPAWNNLLGRAAFPSREAFADYVNAYAEAVHPAVLCDDEYEFLVSGDRGLLTENIATLAGVARQRGLPLWGIVLLMQHGAYRAVTPGMLRWQVAQWLAFGARGIGIFAYWTPPPDSILNWQPAMITWEGERTAAYDTVRALNARLAPIGNTLAGCQWLATEFAGSVPSGGTPFAPDSLLAGIEGRAVLGCFADSTGAPLVLVANSDSLAPRTLTLAPAGGRAAWRLRDDGAGWDALAPATAGGIALALGPGDFALLRLSGGVDSLAAGRAPRLSLAPNPARGSVRFAAAGVADAARLEVLDLAGRRVWSCALPPGTGAAVWSGERDGGGRAGAGLYFARLEDAGGVAVRRLNWLGGR